MIKKKESRPSKALIDIEKKSAAGGNKKGHPDSPGDFTSPRFQKAKSMCE